MNKGAAAAAAPAAVNKVGAPIPLNRGVADCAGIATQKKLHFNTIQQIKEMMIIYVRLSCTRLCGGSARSMIACL